MKPITSFFYATLAWCCAVGSMNSARAGVSISGAPDTFLFGVTDATALQVNRRGGVGHMAVIPYYSTQSGNSTLINISNTDLLNGKAVKVRFRSAANADTVYNFTLLLSPGDVWAANISEGADGLAALTTTDKSCTLPGNVNGSFVTNRLPAVGFTAAQRAEWTREGYVEIITMADVGPSYTGFVITGSPYPRDNPLFDAITPDYYAGKPMACFTTAVGAAALNALASDPASASAAYGLGLNPPTTGLLVTSILINVAGASVAWTTPTTAITAVDAAGKPARGRLVFSPQTADAAPSIDLYTNDPLLRTTSGGGAGRIAAKQHDLPDFSTPYVGAGANALDFPFRHVESLSVALAVKTLRNEYLTETSINARTDWTLTQPTQRFATAVDYTTTPFTAVSNTSVAGPSPFFPPTFIRDNKVCAGYFSSGAPEFHLRSGFGSFDTATVTNPDGTPQSRAWCGVAKVLTFDVDVALSSVLRASITAESIYAYASPGFHASTSLADARAGWVRMLPGTSQGAPLIGAAYIQARGPLVSGKSTNFGVLYNHDTTR